MNRSVEKTEKINYKVKRHFGQSSITELIANSMENMCKSSIVLTSNGNMVYNVFGSVEEDNK